MASGYALPQSNGPTHGRAYSTLSTVDFSGSPIYANELHIPKNDERSGSRAGQGNGHGVMHSHRLPMKGRVRGESDLSRPAGVIGASRYSMRTEVLTAVLLTLQYALFYASFEAAGDTTSVRDPETLAKGETTTSSKPAPVWLYTGLFTGTMLLSAGLAGYVVTPSEQTNKRRASDAAEKRSQGGIISVQGLRSALYSVISTALPIYASLCLSKVFTGLFLVAALVSAPPNSGQRGSTLKQLILGSKWYYSALALCLVADLAGLTTSNTWHVTLPGYACLVTSFNLLPSPLLSSPPSMFSNTGPPPSIQQRLSKSIPSIVATRTASTVTASSGLAILTVTIMAGIALGPDMALSTYTVLLGCLGSAAGCLLLFLGDMSALGSRRKAGLWSGLLVSALASFLLQTPSWLSFSSNLAAALCITIGAILDSSDSITLSDRAGVSTGHRAHYPNVSALTAYLLSKTRSGSLIHDILCEKDSRRIAYFTFLNFAFMLVQGFYGWVSGSLGLLSDTVHMFFDCLALIVGLAASVASKWPTSPEKPYGWSKLNTLAGFGNGVFLMLVSVEFVWGAIEGIMERNELRRVEELLVVSTLGLIVNMIGLLAFGHAHAGHDHGHGHSHGHGHNHATHTHAHSHSHVLRPPSPAAQPALGHAHSHSHDHGHNHGHEEHSHHDTHAHGSHDHHEHDHSHSSTPLHGHDHDHDHDHHHHSHSHSYVPALDASTVNASLYPPTDATIVNPHSGHENENMHGIYLHIAADAGGSLAVIISTTLTLWKPWYLWDPLATIIIAALIFMAAVPLVKESAKKLLLVVPEELEYELKNALQELTMIRGVTGFAAPRFWLEDKEVDAHDHHHHHDHGHTHAGHGHGESKGQIKLRGSIHVFAAKAANSEDVRERAGQFFLDRQMDVVVQVEREGEDRCWCGGGASGGI